MGWRRNGTGARSFGRTSRWALVLTLALVMAACGDDADDGDADDDADPATDEADDDAEEADEEEAEEADDDADEADDDAEEADEEEAEEAAEFECDRIDFVVPVAAGGGSDLYSRTIAEAEMGPLLDTQVAVRNVPGDGQMLGVSEVFRAEPDGCTLTTYNPPSITIAQLARGEDAPIDIREAEYVGQWGSAALTLYGHVDSPGDDLDEVIELYQSGELTTYGAQDRAGPTELLGHLLRDTYGMEWEELVAYDGGGDLNSAILSQEVPYGVTTDTSIQDLIESEQAKVIAVLTDEPSEILPDAPTAVDQGYESLDFIASFTRLVAATPDTPEPQRQALQDALEEALESEEIQEWAEDTGNPVSFADGETAQQVVEDSFMIEDEIPDLAELLEGADED